MAIYLIGRHRLSSDDEGFAAALAEAHTDRLRPKCLCLVGGVEMYVARLGEGYIVKRMPGTGSHHAPDCASYEPPPEASGLGQVLGTAIREDPATGETVLKLGFSLSKLGGRSKLPEPGSRCADSVVSDGSKLSLRGLLHYLWDQAGLARWEPGFAGKRSWGTVRKHLLQAAEHKIARGESLHSRLYIPEVFTVEQRDELNARRLGHWRHAVAAPGRPQHLMLLIGEVKEIVPARYGYRAVIKHVPDQAFALDEALYRRLGRRFEAELALWGATDGVRMLTIATFAVSEAGIPTIAELSLMPVTPQWLPVDNSFEVQLVDRLVTERRSFIKGLRYNLSPAAVVATAALIDTGDRPTMLFVSSLADAAPWRSEGEVRDQGPTAVWLWQDMTEAMPSLPDRIPAGSTCEPSAFKPPATWRQAAEKRATQHAATPSVLTPLRPPRYSVP